MPMIISLIRIITTQWNSLCLECQTRWFSSLIKPFLFSISPQTWGAPISLSYLVDASDQSNSKTLHKAFNPPSPLGVIYQCQTNVSLIFPLFPQGVCQQHKIINLVKNKFERNEIRNLTPGFHWFFSLFLLQSFSAHRKSSDFVFAHLDGFVVFVRKWIVPDNII